jgi:two-component system sensor histidine kinase CreC
LQDRFLLHRAVSNLLRNALDFRRPVVKCAVSVAASERHCSIAVRDHGPGIPDYALTACSKSSTRCAARFRQEGTGLGLAFVKKIAALHRGRAQPGNHPEGGAEARLVLPLER